MRFVQLPKLPKKPALQDAAADTTPPSYENVVGSSPAKRQAPRHLAGRPTRGEFFTKDKRKISVLFTFVPDPSVNASGQKWAAIMDIKCADVPRLMREGFYWDLDNVVHQDGYICKPGTSESDNRFPRTDGKHWQHVRHYFLKDMRRAPFWVAALRCIGIDLQPPFWTANLQLFALDSEALGGFRLENLTLGNVRRAWARSPLGDTIYTYFHYQPGCSVNTIYDDMPLEGWWPWPKADSGNATTPTGV